MNAKIEILDEITHQTLMVDFEEARGASRKETLFPIVLSEFHSLMFHYPIVFVKSQETGEFTCSVLLGVSQNANLLDEQSIIHDEVMPLNIRRLPLLAIAQPGDAAEQRPLIGINMKSPGVGRGEYFLKQKSVAFESALAALSQLYDGYAETKRFVKIALELDLITKLKAEIHYKDKPRLTLEGLYGIDANKIVQLKERDTDSKDLFLEISSYAYAQHFSLHNMKKIAALPG